jgi:DNA repair protein RecO (recombination protein O)
LSELGYGLLLDRTADTDTPVVGESLYDYLIEQGPILSQSQDLNDKIHGRTLISLHNREPLDARGAKEAKRLMRLVLAHYLGERPLKSRELFQTII